MSDYTGYMYLGDLVEFGDTDQIFVKPARKETEDYITGRFGRQRPFCCTQGTAMPTGDHSIKKYDEELEAIRSRVLQMGGLVESQVHAALNAFETADQELAQQAIDADRRVNELEMDVEPMVNYVIARRQPMAGDLRMITGVAKVITDLERIGDEASKIARAVKWLHEKGDQARLNRIPDIKYSGEAVARCCSERSMLSRGWMPSRELRSSRTILALTIDFAQCCGN